MRTAMGVSDIDRETEIRIYLARSMNSKCMQLHFPSKGRDFKEASIAS